MYRNLRISFSRLILNAVPNFANNTPELDASLSLDEQDILFVYQTSGSLKPGKSHLDLEAASFRCGGVTESENVSRRIYNTLLKLGIIFPTSAPNAPNPYGIDTNRITTEFTHKLAFLGVPSQRKVIGLLFFWEQEAVRLHLLEQEEAGLEELIREIEGRNEVVGQDLWIAQKRVKMEKDFIPSERAKMNARSGSEETLQEYHPSME
jgi:hypothetical protein